MQRWPDRRIVDLLGIEIPIIQAPMAGADSVALAQAVSSAGGLGSLACALLTPDEVQEAARALRGGMAKSFNLNFFSHTMAAPDIAAIEKWKRSSVRTTSNGDSTSMPFRRDRKERR